MKFCFTDAIYRGRFTNLTPIVVWSIVEIPDTKNIVDMISLSPTRSSSMHMASRRTKGTVNVEPNAVR